MNVSGNATVTTDATLTIEGSSTAASAAINFNGGNYGVGGTFLTTISDDGAITFNNASVNADVIKAGVFGSNGTLTVGGGTLSANTTLKLYAPSSNGQVNFISNVTLDSNSSVIIAANAVTINNGVVVTITGDNGGASVYTNIPNYTGSGGNDTTTGMFAGNGASTFPLVDAPPFDDPLEAPAKGSTASAATPVPIPATNSSAPGVRGTGAGAILPVWNRHAPIARVTDSNQLLDLADRFTSSSSETAHRRSNTQSSRKSRGPGGVVAGKSRAFPSTANGVPASLALSRNGGRSALRLP